ncbi:MAG: sortase [Dehalococcoidia bacterium]|nr:sortase [Dehalococcoidia bacterium]
MSDRSTVLALSVGTLIGLRIEMTAEARRLPRLIRLHFLSWSLPGAGLLAGVLAVVGLFALLGRGPFADERTATSILGVSVTAVETPPLDAMPEDTVQSDPAFSLPDVATSATQPAPPELLAATGMSIVIPRLGVSQPTVTMGIQGDGRSFQVPNSAHEVAWYNFSGAPGSASANAIFAGHINYHGSQGTFGQLHTMAEGDMVEVHQIDGTVHTYRVSWVRQIYKPSLSWEDVGCQPGQGCTSQNTITLITCGGAFDRASGHYVDNTVVRAELVETRHSLS